MGNYHQEAGNNEGRRLVLSTTRGRYALDDATYGMDLTSGQVCSVLMGGRWVPGRIEGDHEGYYFVSAQGEICGLHTDMMVIIPD